MDDREEIMMISPFKRTLAQFLNADEFYQGLTDALRGIKSLADVGLMHCDVSINNILLEAETYPESQNVIEFLTFTTCGTAATEIALLLQPSGSEGGLHDLDLLQSIPDCQQKVRFYLSLTRVDYALTAICNNQGTLPFMSIPCIAGERHLVIDDMQSLFYVLYISMFKLPGSVPNCYPSAPKQAAFEYPKGVRCWAEGEPILHTQTKEELYSTVRADKAFFFERQHKTMSAPEWLSTAAYQSLPFWRNAFLVHQVFLAAFHENLWREVDLGGIDLVWLRRENVSPRKLIEDLEKYESGMRHLLTDLK
ncbi:hypothetical protein C0992_001750 [Termitomyces sp. T32_za158]|nr:hypothetical protein C0992_001750 [Termitomyces sp. T32_za158]